MKLTLTLLVLLFVGCSGGHSPVFRDSSRRQYFILSPGYSQQQRELIQKVCEEIYRALEQFRQDQEAILQVKPSDYGASLRRRQIDEIVGRYAEYSCQVFIDPAFIRFSFFPSTDLELFAPGQEVSVAGGGSGYWRISYGIGSGRFMDFSVNSER